MNENIDLTKILKDCPKGTEFYHAVYGRIWFYGIDLTLHYPIRLSLSREIYNNNTGVTSKGVVNKDYNGECLLFPSKEQRDWSKFSASWLKKDKFNPNTLQPFDKVLVREHRNCVWKCNLFSYIIDTEEHYPCRCVGGIYKYCIPYNDDTKHLVGTKDEAPEYYKYWED